MFEGTKNIKRHEFDKYVTKVGGNLNANTFFDRTYYYELLPSNELALGLWLESERMLHPTIESIGIKTQKDVVCQEMGQSRDNRPYGRLLTETLKKHTPFIPTITMYWEKKNTSVMHPIRISSTSTIHFMYPTMRY